MRRIDNSFWKSGNFWEDIKYHETHTWWKGTCLFLLRMSSSWKFNCSDIVVPKQLLPVVQSFTFHYFLKESQFSRKITSIDARKEIYKYTYKSSSVFLRKFLAGVHGQMAKPLASSPFSLASFVLPVGRSWMLCERWRGSMNRAVSRYLWLRYRWLPGSCSVTPSVSVTVF